MTDRITRAGRIGLASLATALVAGCMPYRIHTDYDEEVSFRSLRSFAWMDSAGREDPEPENPFLERRVRRAVELVMEERGLVRAPADRADLLVTAFVIGPAQRDARRSRWSGVSCGPMLSVWFGPRYPFGFSRRGTPWLFRSPYWRDPWGYACAYRIGFGYGWFPLYDPPGAYLEGTLVIDVLDRSTRDLIWRGSAEGALLDPRRSDQAQEEIDAVVRRVLERYPPR